MISKIKNKWLRRLAIIASLPLLASAVIVAGVIDAVWDARKDMAYEIAGIVGLADEVWDRE